MSTYTDYPRAISTFRAKLSCFPEEIDPAFGPLHNAGTSRQATGSGQPRFKLIQQGIEFPQMVEAGHDYLANSTHSRAVTTCSGSKNAGCDAKLKPTHVISVPPRGAVRWLRPDYQIPGSSHKVKRPDDAKQVEADLVLPEAAKGKPAWPRDELRALRTMLDRAAAPANAEMLSAAFRGRDSAPRRKAVQKALETLAAAGAAQRAGGGPDGESRYFIPR